MAKSILILKTGSAPAALVRTMGDFEHWITEGLAAAKTGTAIMVFDPRTEASFPAAESLAGIVITGSPAMVTERQGWSERSAAWLRELASHDMPMLGICYGHQLLAQAFGGKVVDHPGGQEIGTVSITLAPSAAEDALFCGLPRSFPAQTVHSQSVSVLPEGAVPLAANGFESHHAFRVGTRIWGVQFHPEFSEAAMRGYISHLAADLAQSSRNPVHLAENVRKAESAASLLPRFATLVSATAPYRKAGAGFL